MRIVPCGPPQSRPSAASLHVFVTPPLIAVIPANPCWKGMSVIPHGDVAQCQGCSGGPVLLFDWAQARAGCCCQIGFPLSFLLNNARATWAGLRWWMSLCLMVYVRMSKYSSKISMACTCMCVCVCFLVFSMTLSERCFTYFMFPVMLVAAIYLDDLITTLFHSKTPAAVLKPV